MLWACTGTTAPGTDDSDAVTPPDTDTDVATDTHTDPPITTTRWSWDAPVVCASPVPRSTTPYQPLDGGSAWQARAFDPTSGSLFVGGGFAIADVTGDGRLDILATSYDEAVQYWVQGDDLTFVDRAASLPALPGRTTGITTADVDGDGDLDAMVTVFKAHDVLLLNDGTGTWSARGEEVGLSGPATGRSMSSSWADVDGDGDLDAFVARYGRLSSPEGLPDGEPSSLFRNDGGTFTEIGPDVFVSPGDDATNPMRIGHTFIGAFTDVDHDTRPDLYVINDFGWVVPSMLWRHIGSVYVRDEDSGAELARENMGLGVGDVNADDVPDFLVTAWDDLALYLSDGTTGRWFESSRARNLRPDFERDQRVAWGAQLGDLDNDGDLDAVVAYGFLPVQSNNVNPSDQPDAVFLQGSDGTFSDVAPSWGLDHLGRGRGVLLVDLDRNGFLDIVRSDLRGPLQVDLATCDDSAWLGLSVRQGGSNPFGIGTRVRVTHEGHTWSTEIRAGGTGYGTSGPPEAHIGLGDLDTVDRVEIIWPDGSIDAADHVTTRRWGQVVRP